ATLVLQCAVYFAQTLLGATFTPAGEWITQPDAALRYGGTVGERPAMFSSFLLPLLLLATADFVTDSSHRLRRSALVALGAATLILTLTRASWIGFALGLLYLVAACARRRILVRRNAGLLALVLLAVMAALAPSIWIRITQNGQEAFEERRALAEMAVRVVRAHPLAGVGAGAYPFVFRDYLTPDLADDWLYVVHNVYLLRAAETGLPGLAALLIFLCVAFRLAAPERMSSPGARRMALGWRAGLIALAWEMLWDMSLGPATNSLLWFFCGLMAAAQASRAAGGAPKGTLATGRAIETGFATEPAPRAVGREAP
ncbi:MAG TPA: O-antigen ligase family protein, partial [Bryobacterales bacterium]|nr:O-antigen ligase family protein [Bryobacterales bacterium]